MPTSEDHTLLLVNKQQAFHSGISRAHKRVHYTGYALELPVDASATDMRDYVARLSTQCYSAGKLRKEGG